MQNASTSKNDSENLSKKGTYIIIYSLDGCLQCTYLTPLFKIAKQLKIVKDINIKSFRDKNEFHSQVQGLLKENGVEIPDLIPVPLIIMNTGQSFQLVNQIVIDECTIVIKDSLDDSELFKYLDLEFDNNNLVLSLVSKIIAETCF